MTEYQYILTYKTASETLTVNPAGWDDIGINLARHETYHSLLRSFTLSLRFAKKTGGGADFIENAYNLEGIKADVQIVINQRDKSTNAFELFFSGTIDLKTRSNERNFVQVGVMDSMKMQKLISRDEINFDLFSTVSADNLSVPAFSEDKTIKLPPIDIVLNSNLTAQYTDPGTVIAEDGTWYINIKNPVYSTNGIGDRLNFNDSSTIYTNSTTENLSVKLKFSGNIHRWGTISPKAPLGSVYISFDVRVFDGSGVETDVVSLIHDIHSSTGDSSFDYNSFVSYNKTVEIEPNGYIYFDYNFHLFSCYSGAGYTEGTLSFEIVEYSPGEPESDCKVLFPHEAFARLVQLSTSEQDTLKLFYSEFFGKTDSEFTPYIETGEGSKDAIFTGYLARQYPNATLNLNFRSLFKTFDDIYNLGMGYDRVNDRFFIEPKKQFYKSSYLMFELGEVSDLKITPGLKKYFSKLTCGSEQDGDYQDYQGAYEFNVKREYSLSAPVKDELNIQAKYRTDSIGIELARRKQYFDNASIDTDFDKEIFIVRTDGTRPVLSLNIEGFPGVEMYYNTMLTPRQNCVRWGNVLRAALYKNSDPIKFVNAAKLISLIIDGINEFSDITQAEFDSALFIPEEYDFKSYVNSSILAILNNDPHGFIGFTYDNVRYEGYLQSIESENYNKDATYKLIAKEVSSDDYLLFEEGNEMLFEDGLNILSE